MVQCTDSAAGIAGQVGPGNAGVCSRTPVGAFLEENLSPQPVFNPASAANAAAVMTAVPPVHEIYPKPSLQPLAP